MDILWEGKIYHPRVLHRTREEKNKNKEFLLQVYLVATASLIRWTWSIVQRFVRRTGDFENFSEE